MKNALIIFASLIVLSPSLHSASLVPEIHKKDVFLKKFEKTFKLKEIKKPTQTHKEQFDELFKQIIKK